MATRLEVITTLITASHSEASKAVPSSSTSGVALANSDGTTWKAFRANVGYPLAVVKLTADGNATLTGPVYLYGYITDDTMWYRLGSLNNGEDITLTSTVGYAERINFPGVFDRVAISATVSANNVNDRYLPMTEHE